MKITIFGATGMVGKYLIDQALIHNHSVRAFGRNVFTKLSTERDNLELSKGYLFDDEDIEEALEGCDAVLSAIGGDVSGMDKTRSLGMKHIVAGMEKAGIKRIVAVGGMGILQANANELLFRTPGFPQMYKPVSEEHFKAWQHLQNSSLDWTMVCPPDIQDAGFTGKFVTKKDYPAKGLMRINSADLAEFMVRQLERDKFQHCRVGISNV
ncbi:MAG: NAD(P)-dependent oxidoreductase [Saprospiraceae bacterium]